jgi:iron only hydrogenase large subunit-like protein
MFELLHSNTTPVYAMIAPAYISQFSNEVTPGKLRTAFKLLGFEGMIEVALFADILTLKEALEFDSTINNKDDFLLTSCCCPIWIGMIKKVYHTLMTHVPPSVSPMVACGRSIKKMYPDAKTVFIGPCVAKKAEAKQEDIADAVDYVLTFQEMKQIFEVAKIVPRQLEEDLRDHSSKAGRTYARTAGVSEAVDNTLKKLKPKRVIPLRAKQADGIPECKELLKKIQDGDIDANFIEGMGCVGGCVGGPKSIIDKDEATISVNKYGMEATYDTPVDNPFVIEMLHRLGFDTIESLLRGDNMFTRNFE